MEQLIEYSKILRNNESAAANFKDVILSVDQSKLHNEDKEIINWLAYDYRANVKLAAGQENNRQQFLKKLWKVSLGVVK